MEKENTDASKNDLAGDLLDGAQAISDFTGLRVKQVYDYASRGEIPGVFTLGRRKLVGMKSVIREGFLKRAQGAA